MKKIKAAVICGFFLMIFVPIAAFNWKEDVVSEIDNRQLTNNPFGPDYVSDGSSITNAVENYVQDRIGFRDKMILAYTVLNDRLFHEMVHPNYTYGRDDYVFLKMSPNVQYGEYHELFADMVKKIQDYCSDRGVPFVFVFDPAKTTILEEELPAGVNYNADWVDEFMDALDARNVNYVNNTTVLREKTENGEDVFNKQYDAGHWNDFGAFYGVNNILENLKEKYFPNLHINSLSEFTITEEINDSLPASLFPIHESDPVFELNTDLTDLTSEYSGELEINPQHRQFRYVINPLRKQEGEPKVLVFQGSYMNGRGQKFLDNALGEYIFVHDYQNVINFDYYFNIFQPECVIFEAAEYTFQNDFFDYEGMKNMELNPPVDTFANLPEEKGSIEDIHVSQEDGKKLVKLSISEVSEEIRYAYVEINGITYDLQKHEEGAGLTVTLDRESFYAGSKKIILITGDRKQVFSYE